MGNDAESNVGYKIVRHGHQHALKKSPLGITLGFQISLAKQAICFNVLGKSLENVTAVRDGLIG